MLGMVVGAIVVSFLATWLIMGIVNHSACQDITEATRLETKQVSFAGECFVKLPSGQWVPESAWHVGP